MEAEHNKTQPRGGDTEDNVYSGVYHVLLTGMFLSTGLFAIGIVLALLHPEFMPLDSKWILQHYSWHNVVYGSIHGDPISVMMLATALLILTPVMRVVVSIYAFAVDKDFKYVFITSIVLFIMIVTVALGVLGLR